MIKRFLKKTWKAAFGPEILRRKVVSCSMPGPRRRKNDLDLGASTVFRMETKMGLDAITSPFSKILKETLQSISGSRVLVKLNLNTADPYPASTSPDFLAFVLRMLKDSGASDIRVGDCSSIRAVPTRSVASKTGIANAAEGLARVVCFDEGPWVSVPVKGFFLKEVTVPKAVFEVDYLICIANIKSHMEADFSFGLKLAVGFMHPMERYLLHRDHLAEKCAEINLAVQPDVTIIDGRRAFITGGPDLGTIAEGDTILMGENPLAVDLEAYRLLYLLKESHGVRGIFEKDPFMHPHLRHARRIGIGGIPWQGYKEVAL